jgi:phage terminase small subunit
MNLKQERFAQEYMIDLNATQAAIRAGYSEHTAYSQGQRLLKHAEVKAAIQAGQAEFRERMKVSKESVTEQLNTAYDMAEANGQTAVMVQATMGIAKVHGLLVDKTEEVKPTVDMTEAELAAESQRIQDEIDALDRADNVVKLPTSP